MASPSCPNDGPDRDHSGDGPPAMMCRLDGRYLGKRDDVDFSAFPFTRVENSSYVVWDGRFSLDIFSQEAAVERWRLFSRISNLFDREYEEVFGFSSAGRSYLAGLEVTF